MGKVSKTVIEFTCDICNNSCPSDDCDILIYVNNGDRDVGPATIKASLNFTAPYGCSNGVICLACKKKYLLQYANSL